MKITSSAKRAGVAVIGVMGILLGPPASATIIHVTDVEVPYYESVTLSGGIFGAGTDPIGIAGQIVLTTDIGTLDTWCVDLFHIVYIGGSYTYTTGPLSTDNSGSSPATSNTLLPTQIAEIEALAAYGNAIMVTSPSNLFSAALQAAIWDVEYGTTATSSDPNFAAALANIDAMLPTLPVIPGVQLFDQDSQGIYQAQGLYTIPPERTVPEPTTLALLAFGLTGLGLSLRRR